MAGIISPVDVFGSTSSNDSNGTIIHNGSAYVHICKNILIQQIGDKSIRYWDLAILVPNVVFMVFLLYKARRIRARLTVTRSPVFKAFYLLVYLITVVSILRCVVSMSISVTNRFGEFADKVLWLALKFFMLSAELCVLTFGLLFGHLDSRTSIRRVLFATALISAAFSGVQSLLEFKTPDKHYATPSDSIIDLFAHGGMIFLMASSSVFVVVYSSICILPFTRFKDKFSLPRKRRFYVYCGFLATIYTLQLVGSVLIFKDNLHGMCVLDFTTYVYFAFYTPVVYITFLRGYVSTTQPGLLFSYRPQKDEAGIHGELPDSGNYFPGLPGITSPSYDDILYHPDFFDSTDFDAPNSPNPLYNYSTGGNYRLANV